jgi:hypothetical protein
MEMFHGIILHKLVIVQMVQAGLVELQGHAVLQELLEQAVALEPQE